MPDAWREFEAGKAGPPEPKPEPVEPDPEQEEDAWHEAERTTELAYWSGHRKRRTRMGWGLRLFDVPAIALFILLGVFVALLFPNDEEVEV